ncbi:hypothetical protein M271_32655 [Streptomyces rapamycinicus NRRL 5491]|nr:hypothetical protein M271_32655 [Streptomyces rapamycinicus NRRL 5491]
MQLPLHVWRHRLFHDAQAMERGAVPPVAFSCLLFGLTPRLEKPERLVPVASTERVPGGAVLFFEVLQPFQLPGLAVTDGLASRPEVTDVGIVIEWFALFGRERWGTKIKHREYLPLLR